LVRWPDDEGKALPKILVENDLRKILASVGALAECHRPSAVP
jgi:hypothetical protein